MLRKGMFLADRYEIIEQIGTGGMSNVYKAKCHKLNRFVAIKVLKQEFNEDRTFVSKFRAEAQSAAGLTHPNIVNVYDVGDENGIYYIVMELIEGITLKKYIEKRGKIPYKEAASIAIQVANGMEAAHNHNIIHRDIKPQNIIISKEGKVKVTDFGIAKAASSSTITSSAMGSVHYISPEQARGGYSDERSDIYSFGITLFEMLTGTVPFNGDTTVAVALKHIQDPIPAPSTLTEGIPISIDQIVLKCTQKKVEQRYQNASELIVDLKRSLVMPNEQFVKMAAGFAAINLDQAGEDQDEESLTEDENEESDDLLEDDDDLDDDDLDDDDLDDDDLDDDDLDDDLDDDADILDDDEDDDDDLDSKKSKKDKKKNKKLLKGPGDEEADIDDEGNDKLDMIFKWIGVGIIAIIVLMIIFLVVKFVGSSSSSSQEETTTVEEETTTEEDDSDKVEVPDVKNMTEAEAKAALNAVGLGYKATTQSSDTVDEGYVITQGTKAGTMVEKNTTITLIISSGSASVTVPSVVGKTEDAATSTLTSSGFDVEVKYEYSDSVDQGYVIRQSPSANASASSGDTVTITVSQGKETTYVTVPDLSGMTESTARQTLDNLGLEVELTSSSVTGGTVTYQSYSSGSSVAEGTTIKITLTVAATEETTTTATATATSYVGYTAATAKSNLESAGFTVVVYDTTTKTTVTDSTTLSSYSVLQQDKTGTQTKGATITLTITTTTSSSSNVSASTGSN